MTSISKPKFEYKKVKWYFGKEIEIPVEWDIIYLQKFLKISMGQSPPSETYNEQKKGLPFFQGVTEFGYPYPVSKIWCSQPQKIAMPDQILFSVRAPVGEINMVKIKCSIGRGLASLIPIESDSRYCFYLLQQFKNQFIRVSQGAIYNSINKNDIESIQLPFTTDLPEQQKIASILSNVDALIEKTQEIIEKTERLKKGLMQELFIRGIDQKKFKNIKWLFRKEIEIPEEWEIQTLGKIGKFSKGKDLSKKDLEPHGKIKAIPYTALYTDFDEIIDCDKIKNYTSKNLVIINGEHILIAGSSNMLANIGKAAAINAVNVAIGGDVIIYKTNINVYFLSYLLSSNTYRNRIIGLSQGITIRHIYPSMLQKLTLCLPTPPEQIKIASILSGVDACIQKNQEYKNKLERLKKGLMQNLLTGRMRVRT